MKNGKATPKSMSETYKRFIALFQDFSWPRTKRGAHWICSQLGVKYTTVIQWRSRGITTHNIPLSKLIKLEKELNRNPPKDVLQVRYLKQKRMSNVI